jgi:hypothetical protein
VGERQLAQWALVRALVTEAAASGQDRWAALGRGLAPQGFVTFGFSALSGDALASLDHAVAASESQFVEVTQRPQWGVIAARLRQLAQSAVFLALRSGNLNIDLFVGRVAESSDVTRAKDYCEFVRRLLADMHGATKDFHLTDATIQLVNAAAQAANPAVRQAAGLVLPLVHFHGAFSCRVVFAVPGVTADAAAAWARAQIVASSLAAPKAYVEGWLWDMASGRISDTDNSAWLARLPITNLDSAAAVEQNLRYT